jgi:hypothetical protein
VAQIQVRFMTEGLESLGELSNVSRAGLFVRASDVPRPGTVVALQFHGPDENLVDLRGEVRWNTHGLGDGSEATGFGVLLYEPPREYREFYLWAVSEVDDDKGAESDPL